MPDQILRQSGRVQPVLVNVHQQRVRRVAGVVRPKIRLAQTDAVEWLARQSIPAVG